MRPAPRWLSALRMLAVAMLVFGLVARPVLASIGETHELAHDPSGQHGHAIEMGTAADGDASEERSPGHALLHFAHCCGQMSVTMTEVPSLSGAALIAGPLLVYESGPAAAGVRGSPFRPPIRA